MSGVRVMPEYDARVEAWLTARNYLESARKLTTDHKGRVVKPLPDYYWGALAEAKLWIALATADEAVGKEAGGHLLMQREAEALRKDKAQSLLDKFISDGWREATEREGDPWGDSA